MGAGTFVGRVGGLAIGLGVGAAVFNGIPLASADDSAPNGPSAGSSQSASTHRSPASPQRTRRVADRASSTVETKPARNTGSTGTATRQYRSVAAQEQDATPRKRPLRMGSSLTVDPETQWSEGLLLGTLNAVSARGLETTHRVLSKPSLGGKVAWEPKPEGATAAPDVFSYLPVMEAVTDPAKSETFRVLVAEVTGFDKFLTSLPLLGTLAGPMLELLHRTPILKTVLAPIIGAATVTQVTENANTLAAGRPVAFTYMMSSFDGTPISVNYFPAVDVATGAVDSAPTVLNGPDLGFPGNTDAFSIWAPSLVNIVPGIPTLRTGASPFDGGYTASTGFNVITWDPRGEWASGGVLQLDSPFFEARDVSSIISWAASQANVAQTQVATDAGGDPLVGMVGGSYGGGIQLTTAATDPRIDAIVPGIAWNTLNESLYPNNRFKTVIGTELLLALVGTRARINSLIYPAIITGDLFSWLNESEQALLASAGVGVLAERITAPSLFLQGTVDILFELDAANSNAESILNGNPATPVKMTWFCGGHGVCLLPTADQQAQGVVNMNDSLRWLDQYVSGNTSAGADAIPTFQWFDQAGSYHSSDLRPFDASFNNPISLDYTDDGGRLLLVPLLGGSGPSQAAVPPEKATLFSSAFAFASGGKARNALNLDVTPPVGTVIAGAPNLSFSYQGVGISRTVYAQLVDNATGQVVGNIVTPVPVKLDGRPHSVSIPMADIAYTVNNPGDSMTLQITSSALPYAHLFSWGSIRISGVDLEVPTVA